MINRIAIIVPEFTREKTLHVPWKQAYEIAKRLNHRGIETCIITSNYRDCKIDNVPIINLNQKYIRVLNDESKKKIFDFSPDVIYWYANPYSGIYLRKNHLRIPLVLHISTIHQLLSELKYFNLKEVLESNKLPILASFYPFSKIVASYLNASSITGIISSSKTITNRMIKLGIDSTRIITSPLFFKADINSSQENIVKNKKEIIVCYLGPYDTLRGSTIILEALKILRRRKMPVRLLFLLRTWKPEVETPIIEKKIKEMEISNYVELISGILTKEKIMSYMQSCDIITLPTKFVWSEPPITMFEAMYLGKPLITTNASGIRELTGGNAITIKPSAEEFARSIEQLANDKKRRIQMGEAGKKYVDSLPGWDALTDWTLAKLEHFAMKR